MKDDTSKVSRRRIFAGAGTLGALATAASVLPSLEVTPQEAAPTVKAPANGGGYHLSEHVKRYFKTTLV
jgi:hypothetical protein